MKTKTVLGLASLMIFGAALFLGLAVTVIFFLAGQRNNEPEASLATTSENSNSEFLFFYDSANGKVSRLNLSDASYQSFDMGLGDKVVYFNGKAVSPDGRLLAVCTVEEEASGVYVNSRFIVRDVLRGQNLIEQSYHGIPGCNPSAFSPDSSRVAVAFVFNSPIDGQMNFPDEPNWALRIFDVNTGAVVQETSAASPDAPDFGAMTGYWFEEGISPMAKVISYGEDSLYFIAYPFVGRDGPPASPAFHWDFATNALTQIEGLGNNGATFLAETGEIAYPYHNEAFPAAQAMGPVALANEIHLTDASGSHTIYRDSDNVIASVTFVNGGRQLAALLFPNYDPEAEDESLTSRYILINRDGSVENMNSASQNYAQLFATSEGFGVLKIEQRQNADGQYTNFHQVLSYENGQLSTIWEYNAPMSSNGQIWLELLWASPQQIAPNLAPFEGIE